ncbi:MAG: hypothetical protein QM760_02645 [Nibricoccus sp.]
MNTPINQGKVIIHGTGAGGITASDVEQRAKEIAAIAGRTTEPTLEDREKAVAELSGQTVHPTLNDDGQSMGAITRDPSQEPVYFGNQKAPAKDLDEQESVERLTLEGVEEAQHDQMVASRNKDRRGL